MSDLGNKLKEARESQGLTISEVSLSTKIGARMLKALEEGNFKILPALPFAKGFVRSYSAYLKLDPDQMVQLFLEEKGEGLAPAPISTSESEPNSNLEPAVVDHSVEKEEAAIAAPGRVLESSSPWNRVMIIGGVVVLILAVVGIKNLVEKYKREGVVSESSGSNVVPIEKEEAAKVAAEPAEPQVANPEEAKPQTTNSQEAPAQVAEVEKAQPAPEPIPEQKKVSSEPAPASAPPVEETAAKVPEPTPAETPPSNPSETSTSSDVATKATKEILLEALDKVRVNIRVGEESQSLQLQAGQVHMLRTSQKVVLDLSDGGAVNLVVNGRSRGVPGSLGEPKKVRLP